MPENLDKIRVLLHEHDWNDTYPRLVRFALGRIRGCYWYGKKGKDMAVGKQAEDFVGDAIEKTYRGIRKWNLEKYSDLYGFLCGVIWSDINHAAVSSENRKTVELDTDVNSENEELSGRHDLAQKSILLPLDELIRKEDEEYLFGFIDFIDNDPKLIKVVENIMEGTDTPREIADSLKVSVSEIYNIKKKLCRRLKEYQKKRKLQEVGRVEGGESI